MKELGMALLATTSIGLFCAVVIYPDMQYTGGSSNSSCYGECYEEYVAQFGTSVEQEQRKQALAAEDEFSSIKGLWAGCAACHGMEGQGMAVFPKLAGQSADYITDRLITYKNRGEVGPMSSTMWAQAGMLSDNDIQTIGKFIEETMK
jgi:cytochrome c553